MSEKDPPAGRLEGREHVLPIRVYYDDTDFTGAVYHGRYVGMLDQGRTEHLRAMGIGHARLLDDHGMAFAIVRLDLAFRRPARIDDLLAVRTRYERLKGPRLFVSQRIVRDADLIAEARVEIACIDLAGRPRKPPKALIDAVRPSLFEGAP